MVKWWVRNTGTFSVAGPSESDATQMLGVVLADAHRCL